jgi:hypothetical protein
MRFTVPQFIDHSPKIVGPLTFKQFLFVGGAGGACFILYFILPKAIFLTISILLIGLGSAMAFIKINGKALPLILIDMLRFKLDSKMYIWKKKEQPIMVYKKKEKPNLAKKTVEKESVLKIGGKSRLKEINTDLETKTK